MRSAVGFWKGNLMYNIYAFIFDQKGAMYALGIQGNKITKIKK